MLKAGYFISVLVALVAVVFVIRGQVPPGGHIPVSPDDPRLQPALDYATANINADTESKFCQVFLNVSNATEQMVDGLLFTMRLTMQESEDCLAEECMASTVLPSKCEPSTKSKPYPCDVIVVIKSWSVPTHLVQNLTCEFPPK